MGDDHALEIAGIGTIKITMFDGTIRTIGEVQHVNGLKKNLLSLGQMDSHGYKTHVENGIMKIVKGALVLMKAEKISANLFMLKGETLQEADACVASNGRVNDDVASQTWSHVRTRSIARSKCILDLIHSDVWESPDISMGGAKYMATFIDDYSRRCWVYSIKKKSDVFPVFKEYKARVELESGKKIKCLRTDNGGKYTDGEFLAFSIGLKTTMEMWTGKPADYSYLHAFGCPMYVMYNAQERTKLDAKSRRCIFLGYADGVKGYHLWDPTAHKIVISRDVIFVEDQLQKRDENDSTAKEKSEIVPVYVENNSEDLDSSEAAPEYEEQEPIESEAPEVRRSTRERRLLAWHSEYVTEINVAYCLLTEDGEPSTFYEALESSDVALWMTAMQEEIEALHKNKTLSSDHCAYYKRFEDNDFIILLLYMDDMLVAEFTVRGYVDSDVAGDLDKRKSTTGYVFTLAGAAVSWVSKLQTVVALSTTEAEYMAATQACKEAIWIQRLLKELGHKQ
ncbi:Integrase catalytic domain-containing protein [Citrus sinensis]|nr:Integrase catalytic domain-containing protein [Citrus sinensis]